MKTSVSYLLQQNPALVQEWLESAWSGQYTVDGDPNWWLSLAQGAAFRAIQNLEVKNTRNAIEWAQIAISIYNYLANILDTDSRNSYECSAMFLRAKIINELGDIFENPISDLESIKKWFLNGVIDSPENISSLAMEWNRRSIGEIRQLRQLKNRLAIIDFLIDKGHYKDDKKLHEWVELKNRLP